MECCPEIQKLGDHPNRAVLESRPSLQNGTRGGGGGKKTQVAGTKGAQAGKCGQNC
jgi:hypothetical protein